IAGIQSATSRQNTKDQVYAQNEMLAYQQKESTARVASIMENTNLSKQQQVSEIMRQMLTQAQTAGQYFTNDQIKEMTRKRSEERRVGKECRTRGSPRHYKKKNSYDYDTGYIHHLLSNILFLPPRN